MYTSIKNANSHVVCFKFIIIILRKSTNTYVFQELYVLKLDFIRAFVCNNFPRWTFNLFTGCLSKITVRNIKKKNTNYNSTFIYKQCEIVQLKNLF